MTLVVQSSLDNVPLAEMVNLKRLFLIGDPSHPATRILLASVVSPHIRVIGFINNVLNPNLVAEPGLLERALNGPNLSRLTEVWFNMFVRPERHAGRQGGVRKGIPGLAEEGYIASWGGTGSFLKVSGTYS